MEVVNKYLFAITALPRIGESDVGRARFCSVSWGFDDRRLRLLSADAANISRSKLEALSAPTTSSTATCKILAALGKVCTIVGVDGAKMSQLSLTRPPYHLPSAFQPLFSASTPSFSKARLISNVFFSCKTCSIVIAPFDALPVLGGKPASRRNVSKVCHGQICFRNTMCTM